MSQRREPNLILFFEYLLDPGPTRQVCSCPCCWLLLLTCLRRWEGSSQKRLDINLLFYYSSGFSLNVLNQEFAITANKSQYNYGLLFYNWGILLAMPEVRKALFWEQQAYLTFFGASSLKLANIHLPLPYGD